MRRVLSVLRVSVLFGWGLRGLVTCVPGVRGGRASGIDRRACRNRSGRGAGGDEERRNSEEMPVSYHVRPGVGVSRWVVEPLW